MSVRADQASSRFEPSDQANAADRTGQVPPAKSGEAGAAASATVAGARRRGRNRRRRYVALTAVILVIFSAATARLFIWPTRGMPARVDAIVVLAGPGKIQPLARDLAREHRARYLVVSLGTPPSRNHCPRPISGVQLICFNPVPATTQGEAEFAGRLAQRYHWRSISVVTITSQATRARLRVQRCFAGHVYVVTVPPDPARTNWPYQIAYQWAALFKAELLQRSC